MKVIVRNLAVEYRDAGTGPVLLLLHGWMHSLGSFDALAAELSERYRVVRVDFPGFGESELPQSAWDVGDYAAFTADFIEKLGLAPAALVGHSFGGRVILKGLGSGVLRAQKAVLIASAGNARRRSVRNLLFGIAAKGGAAATFFLSGRTRERLRERLYRAARSDYGAAGALSQTFVKTVSEDLSEDAARIHTPTLLLWGARDATTPLPDGERLRDVIHGAQLVVFPEAGHLVHQEEAAGIAAAIEQFV